MRTFYNTVVKRLGDFMFALTLLLFLSPIIILLILLLLVFNNGAVFFYQKRPGRNEKVFKIIKFKTMNDARDANNNLLPDSERLTVIGRLVRKTSLDEIPQLINVFLGDMSLIGPRPLLIRYLPYYTDKERLRHSVRPGITGLAQISGRNTLNWDERLQYDVEYVENMSLRLDLKIFFNTIKNVLTSKDIVVDAGTQIQDLDAYRKGTT